MKSPELNYVDEYLKYLKGERKTKPSIPNYLCYEYNYYVVVNLQNRAKQYFEDYKLLNNLNY